RLLTSRRSALFPYTTLFRSLRGHGAFDRPVPGVVDPRRELVDREPGARQEEQLDGQEADHIEAADEPSRDAHRGTARPRPRCGRDRKSTRLNSSHSQISYAV